MTARTLAGCLLVIAWLAGWPAAGAESLPSCERQSVRLLSYNVRVDRTGESWPRRRAGVIGALTEPAADIVALQEASEFMLADYAEILSDYRFRVGERSDGHRSTTGWYEYLPIYYRPERFAVVDAGSFWVADDPDDPGGVLSGSKTHGRVLNWIRFRDRCTDAEFLLANVHTHGEQADKAIALIVGTLRFAAPGVPLILAGDFNSEPDSAAYRTATERLDLVDTRAAAERVSGRANTFFGSGDRVPEGASGYKTGSRERRLDYVFADPVPVHRFATVSNPISGRTFPSDHLPIHVELSPHLRVDGPPLLIGREDYVSVVAHRACWADAPENSYAAIDACLELGVDVIEIDVRQTGDGKLVVFHDATVERMTTARGSVADWSLERLSSLKLKSRDGGAGSPETEERIPELASLLEHYRGRAVFNLDVKTQAAYETTVATVQALGMIDEVLIKRAGVAADSEIRNMTRIPGIQFMPIIRETMGDLQAIVEDFEVLDPVAYEVVFQSPNYLASIDRVSTATVRPIWVNTLKPQLAGGLYDGGPDHDADSTWGLLIENGVRVIQTDYPESLIQYLEDAGFRR